MAGGIGERVLNTEVCYLGLDTHFLYAVSSGVFLVECFLGNNRVTFVCVVPERF
jgi:hypothetical protein